MNSKLIRVVRATVASVAVALSITAVAQSAAPPASTSTEAATAPCGGQCGVFGWDKR